MYGIEGRETVRKRTLKTNGRKNANINATNTKITYRQLYQTLWIVLGKQLCDIQRNRKRTKQHNSRDVRQSVLSGGSVRTVRTISRPHRTRLFAGALWGGGRGTEETTQCDTSILVRPQNQIKVKLIIAGRKKSNIISNYITKNLKNTLLLLFFVSCLHNNKCVCHQKQNKIATSTDFQEKRFNR